MKKKVLVVSIISIIVVISFIAVTNIALNDLKKLDEVVNPFMDDLRDAGYIGIGKSFTIDITKNQVRDYTFLKSNQYMELWADSEKEKLEKYMKYNNFLLRAGSYVANQAMSFEKSLAIFQFDIKENTELKNTLDILVKGKIEKSENTTIDFYEITKFKWDKLYIVTPYVNPKKYSKKHGIEGIYSVITNIELNDDINCLVFVLNNKIVSYVNYPRNKGDFCNIEKTKTEGFTPKEAKFQYVIENGWINVTQIKDVI